MKCPICGTSGMGKYCGKCGRMLRCPSCGCENISNFCTYCGKMLNIDTEAEQVVVEIQPITTSQIKKPVLLLLATVISGAVVYYNAFYKDSRVSSKNPPSEIIMSEITAPESENTTKKEDFTSTTRVEDDSLQKIETAKELTVAKKYEDAIKVLREVPSTTPYFEDAQAEIDKILPPLAEDRLAEAKRLFDRKDYPAAYAKLQAAYGTVSPPLPEILQLLPLYQAKAVGGSNKTPNTSNIKVTNNDKWTKLPGMTNGYDWMSMTDYQKQELAKDVIKSWLDQGKKVNKDFGWFVKGLDSFYKNGQRDLSVLKSMNIIAIGGLAFEE